MPLQASYLPDWLKSCGMPDADHRYNPQWVAETHHLGTRWRDVQRAFVRQEIWILDRESDEL